MAITTSAMVATVFVLNLYGMKEKPVPVWAKKVFITYLARILCMCNCIAPPDSFLGDLESGQKVRHKYKLVHTAEPVSVTKTAADASGNGGMVVTNNSAAAAVLLENSDLRNRSASSSTLPSSAPTPIHHNIFEKATKAKAFPAKPDYGKDWVHVAAVCDRLFFWLCLTFIVITTLLLFHPLTTSRYFKIPLLERKSGGAV